MKPSFIIYVVRIGSPQYAANAEPFLRDYCRRYGYPLVFGSMAADTARHPAWQKLLVHRWVEADFVLVVDLDLLPLPHAPPIHEHLRWDRLNLAFGRRYSRRVKRLLVERGVPADAMKYNSGLIGVPRDWAPFLEDVYHKADVSQEIFMEQGDLNIALHRQAVDVHVLDQRWNWFLPMRQPFDPALTTPYFWHFLGVPRRRENRIRRLWENYYGPRSQPASNVAPLQAADPHLATT